jgi:serine/threonine-protein kinase HipA
MLYFLLIVTKIELIHMAQTLWGKVYFKDTYAGRLEEQPGGRCVFTYDNAYLDDNQPAIAHTLPLSPDPYLCERGLHPFFDNLIAEGWFRNAQARALGIDPNNRFALLLGFGYDLAGAVSVIDPEPAKHYQLNHTDEATLAALRGRASLSGVQRKLLVVKDGKEYRPVKMGELSTHIAKLASGNLSELLELEYLTTTAARAFLPNDQIVEMELTAIPSIHESALIIPRFDRLPAGKRLRHFEEFNQLLGKFSGDDKYEGDYEDMGHFILNTLGCIPAEANRLFRRILVCLLMGNTDAHFKNFAMFHTRDGLRLTPCYDLVASSIYPDYQSIALGIAGKRNLDLARLKAKNVLVMGQGYGLNDDEVFDVIETINERLPNVLATLGNARVGSKSLQNKLSEKIEKRWNGSFASIGKLWSKRQNNAAKSKS